MLTLHTRLEHADRVDGELQLTYDQREKRRLRARLDTGEEVTLFTPRGSVLNHGDLLTGESVPDDLLACTVRRVIRIVAAPEAVYAIYCATANLMARCAFHLGNRHTQVQIRKGFLRIRADPVLKEMVEGLGARVEPQMAPFEPECGPYPEEEHTHAGEQINAVMTGLTVKPSA